MKSFGLFISFILFSTFIYTQSINIPKSHYYVNENWNTLIERIDSTEGHIKLHTNKWLMCFLHWRPLTHENSVITPEYVRKQLLTFWGPNMDHFSLKNTEGKMEINGHQAYYVDGDFMGLVDTRFIVWNCPETQRQFIADININKRMGTPNVYLELQQLIAKTTICHGKKIEYGGWVLPKRYVNDTLNISFLTPAHWKTGVFEAKTWFPDGPSDKCASLWTLSTTSEKQIDILWHRTENELNKESIFSFFDKAQDEKGLHYRDVEIDTVYSRNNFLMFKGHYTFEKDNIYNNKYSIFSDTHQFIGEARESSGNIYYIVVSIIDVDKVWDREVTLSPEEKGLLDLLNYARERLKQKIEP